MDDTQQVLARVGGRFLVLGGLVLAAVTWSELLVGPLTEPELVLDPVPARAVHLVSYLAIPMIVLGMAALALVLRDLGPALVAACTGIGLGFLLGALPHTVLDFAAIPDAFERLPRADAHELVDRFYAIIGPLAGVGILSLAAGVLTLAFLGLVRGRLPRALAWASLATLPAAVVLGVLAGALPDLPVPHPPVAFDLLVAFYGLHLMRSPLLVQRVPSAA